MDGEGAVLLAAYRHKVPVGQLAAAEEKGADLARRLATCRDVLTTELAAARSAAVMARVWLAWRAATAMEVRRRLEHESKTTLSEERAAAAMRELESEMGNGQARPSARGAARSPHGVGSGGGDGVGANGGGDAGGAPYHGLPPPVGRRELYRLSYEALIDVVLEQQQQMYDNARVPMPPIQEVDASPPRSGGGVAALLTPLGGRGRSIAAADPVGRAPASETNPASGGSSAARSPLQEGAKPAAAPAQAADWWEPLQPLT